ncbi:hypothetical protein ACWEWK_21745, partial [Streptomyces sp. NPDC003757]
YGVIPPEPVDGGIVPWAARVSAGRHSETISKPYPKEFREDDVKVARTREPGVALEQMATDFGVHPITLSR